MTTSRNRGVDPDGRVSQHRSDIGIANTVAWSPDDRYVYFGDTLANLDTEDYLWNHRFHGHRVVGVAPDGDIDEIIELPVRNVTSCTFGGADRTTVFITTAAADGTAGERLAGSLFALRTEVPGILRIASSSTHSTPIDGLHPPTKSAKGLPCLQKPWIDGTGSKLRSSATSGTSLHESTQIKRLPTCSHSKTPRQ
jgi:SMP-30/Gluconolactonase/LRE-like region